MPLHATRSVGDASQVGAPRTASAEWIAWTTDVRLVVTDPTRLPAARADVVGMLEEIDRTASRFRPDSEVSRLGAHAGETLVSPLLAQLVAVALDAARRTDGLVDPTLGATLVSLGYGGDLWPAGSVPSVSEVPVQPRSAVTVQRPARWQDVRLDGRRLHVPPGVLLDLGATAKAWAADRCAALVADRHGCGVLVSLGGDLRVAGPPPEGGWQVRVQDGAGEPVAQVVLAGAAAVATSSTRHRRWRTGTWSLHHILDPVTGLPAPAQWRTVTVAAESCVRANTLSTAAVVAGRSAPEMLRRNEIAARLVGADGAVQLIGGWPA